MASGFSILATRRACLPAFLISSRSSKMSEARRTKDKPIQSTSFSSAKAKSSASFGVMQGNDTSVSGRFNPLRGRNSPP